MILIGDAVDRLQALAELGVQVQTCVTSPPYFGLRDYGVEGQIGVESTPDEYVSKMVDVFRQVRRLLRDDGTLWLNLGDSYARNGGTNGGGNRAMLHLEGKQTRMTKLPEGTGLKNKDLIGIPWRVAFALQADGWYLRQDIIWNKPNAMPSSATDRCTTSHEYVFLLTKSDRYFFDYKAIEEPSVGDPSHPRNRFDTKDRSVPGQKPQKRTARAGKNEILGKRQYSGFNERWDAATANGAPPLRRKRSVWTVATKAYKEAHFATFPTTLIEPCILAGSRRNDVVLDPFMGSGTVAQVSIENGRRYLGVELDAANLPLQAKRIAAANLLRRNDGLDL